jgi:hypothetical protein
MAQAKKAVTQKASQMLRALLGVCLAVLRGHMEAQLRL